MKPDPFTTTVRRGCGHRFAIRTPSLELTAYLDDVYAALPLLDEDAEHHRYELAGPDDLGRWAARSDGEVIGEPGPRPEALGLLLWCINRNVVGSTPEGLTLHAGGVRLDGVGVVLPGDMEVGKSTLTAGLLRAGADYLSDELIVLQEDGTLSGYAKALSLDPGSWSLFPELEPVLSDDVSAWLPQQWQLSPRTFGVDVVSATQPGIVAFPAYRRDAPTSVIPLRGAGALERLAGCVFPNELPTVVVYQRLAELLNRVAVYELTYGDLDDAVGAVRARALAGRAGARTGSARMRDHGGLWSSTTPPAPDVRSLGPDGADEADEADEADDRPAPRAFPRPGVTLIEVHGEGVLHRADGDELVLLNEYGTAIWGLLAQQPSIEALATELAALTGKPTSEHCDAIARFAEELARHGVMTLEPVDPDQAVAEPS